MFRIFLLSFLFAGAFAMGAETKSAPAKKDDPTDWKSLFDGKTLGNWKQVSYGSNEPVKIENGCFRIGNVSSMSGIKYVGKDALPKIDYEIRYQARRIEGSDFFGAVVFPVDKTFCAFINGGWGGNTIGLSNIDHSDASENNTSDSYEFKEKHWYKIRVRVTKKEIVVWMTPEEEKKEKEVVRCDIVDRNVDLRFETQDFTPLGFCTWSTTGEIRNIEIRSLKPSELRAEGK